jgi:hypothetical protein
VDTPQTTPFPDGFPTGPFPQVGTDAAATVVRLGRRLYLTTVCTGKEGSISLTNPDVAYTSCYEEPFSEEEERALLQALADLDHETWDYSALDAWNAAQPPPTPLAD